MKNNATWVSSLLLTAVGILLIINANIEFIFIGEIYSHILGIISLLLGSILNAISKKRRAGISKVFQGILPALLVTVGALEITIMALVYWDTVLLDPSTLLFWLALITLGATVSLIKKIGLLDSGHITTKYLIGALCTIGVILILQPTLSIVNSYWILLDLLNNRAYSVLVEKYAVSFSIGILALVASWALASRASRHSSSIKQ